MSSSRPDVLSRGLGKDAGHGRTARSRLDPLNACSERYGQQSPDHVPRTIPVTLGYVLVVSGLLTTFVAGFVVYAIAALADGNSFDAALALLLASPFVFALAVGWRHWRRGTFRRGARFRTPEDADERTSGEF